MLGKKSAAKILMGFLTLAVLLVPQLSYADIVVGWHDHPGWGAHFHALPHGYVTVRVGLHRYYYYDGLYYNNVGGDYVLVAPPSGAYVNVIPHDFQPMVISRRTYYTNNGVYYIKTRNRGYKVVAAPVVYVRH